MVFPVEYVTLDKLYYFIWIIYDEPVSLSKC